MANHSHGTKEITNAHLRDEVEQLHLYYISGSKGLMITRCIKSRDALTVFVSG